MEAGESIEKAEAGTDSQWVSKMPQEVVLSCPHKKNYFYNRVYYAPVYVKM